MDCVVATRICFVCLGNICRSPTAEGVMSAMVKQRRLAIEVQSAGTAAYHVGERADHRTRRAGEARGYGFESVAQHFTKALFERFDLVIAMDVANLRALERLATTAGEREKIHLLLDFDAASAKGADVPDPYYGGESDFEHVVDLCERACAALLDSLAEGRAHAG